MPNRPIQRRIWSSIAVLAAVLGTLTAVTFATPRADAADASKFTPGMIMSDQVFYNSQALTAAQAQAFIVSKGSSCTNNGSIPCLKNLTVSSPSIAANQYCSAIGARGGLKAGTVFATVGTACGISPSVLITLVEKEQGLVSTTRPTSYMYQEAAGFACPDTAPCSANYAGFFSQVYAAARQFQIYRAYPSSFNYQAGRTNNIQYNPNAACGTEAVYIKNQATAGLYDYTPYVPNAAAMNNLYGVGDSCSAYGNRNFWRIYSDWFGDPTGSLLKCPTFDGCATGWNFSGSPDRALYSGAAAHSGTGYLAVAPRAKGDSISQTVSRSMTVGARYEGTIWIRTAAAGSTAKGRAVVWGAGGTGNENSVQSFSVGSTWTQLTVNFQAAQRSHKAVILQLYFDTPGVHVYLDDATLSQVPSQPAKTRVPLHSPSFEQGAGAWPTSTGFVNRAIYTGAAQNGKSFFATNTTKAGNAFGQRVSWPVSTATAYTASIWVKSANGLPFSGRLALWAVGSASTNAVTSFKAGAAWTQIQVTLPVTRSGQNQFIFEIYEDTTGRTLYVDNASLTTSVLANGSLEQGATGWSPEESGTNLAVTTPSAAAGHVDVTHIGATNTASANGSIKASVTRQVWKGQTYTATIWLRAANTGATFTGTLALWELGPDGNLNSAKTVSVGNKWTKFTVSHTIQNSSSTSLLLQLYESTPGITADFDGAAVN